MDLGPWASTEVVGHRLVHPPATLLAPTRRRTHMNQLKKPAPIIVAEAIPEYIS
jgi:hypothetical protein